MEIESTWRLEQGNYREQFADFLDRLALRKVSSEEWSSFIITHYKDEFLEAMRICTVRLEKGILPVEHEMRAHTLRAWAIALRSCSYRDKYAESSED